MAHILIIEDDEQFRTMLATMLEADRHRVSLAADGEEGLRMASQLNPDLIITDILMPKLDGIELVLALKRQGKNMPVLAISGGRRSISAEFNLNSASLLGVAATMSKPFSRDELRRTLDQLLGTTTRHA